MWGLQPADLPLLAWYVATLVVLEGLLSADNALVLAVMVRHLPRKQQKKALRYGIWGAMGFRLIAVLLSTVLMRFWAFKIFGGLYLVYLAVAHFLGTRHEVSGSGGGSELGGSRRFTKGFWATVASVELADIAFSIDSILAAVGMAESLPSRLGDNWRLAIVYTGGVLGIVTMRFVAGYFIILLERFPGLTTAAYLLVAWIGLKLMLSGAHDSSELPIEMPGWLFWTGMATIIIVSMLRRSRHASDDTPVDPALRLLADDVDAAPTPH
jgi:YkoY family integral membrane protein